jgi:GH25 family lysozyme M1 (1,4-beta-N-acetylmuramidase)
MVIKMNGIDVSRWQGIIDFKKVKQSGIDFVIIKAGGSDAGLYIDRCFEQNYKNAKGAGLNLGAYYFVGKNCTSSIDGKADAERFEKMLRGKQFEMPVYIDLEATTPANKKGVTDAVIAFCEHMENCGYYVGIYASDIGGFKDKLDNSRLAAYDHWVARYGSTPSYVTEYGMWQCSSTGKVPGIVGNVDIDMSYKDYPTIMRNHKLNGYK